MLGDRMVVRLNPDVVGVSKGPNGEVELSFHNFTITEPHEPSLNQLTEHIEQPLIRAAVREQIRETLYQASVCEAVQSAIVVE